MSMCVCEGHWGPRSMSPVVGRKEQWKDGGLAAPYTLGVKRHPNSLIQCHLNHFIPSSLSMVRMCM